MENSLFKQATSLVLAYALTFSPFYASLGQAQVFPPTEPSSATKDDATKTKLGKIPDGITSKDAKEFKRIVDGVVYSLDTLEDVVLDLTKMEDASRRAITDSITQKVLLRLSTAFDLLSAIMYDFSIPLDQKKAYVRELSSSLGAILFKVIRHQGVDPILNIDPAKEAAIRNNPNMSPQEKRDAILALEDEEFMKAFPGGNMPVGRFALTTLKEALYDVKSFFSVAKSQDNQKIWASWERIKREKLGRETLVTFEKFATETLAPLQEATKGSRGFWDEEVISKMKLIRETRVNSQKAMVGSALALGAMMFVAPPLDLMGVIDGRSANSLFASSLIYLSAWTTVGLLKAATVSSKIVKELGVIQQILRNPAETIAKVKRGLRERVQSLLPFTRNRRNEFSCEDLWSSL